MSLSSVNVMLSAAVTGSAQSEEEASPSSGEVAAGSARNEQVPLLSECELPSTAATGSAQSEEVSLELVSVLSKTAASASAHVGGCCRHIFLSSARVSWGVFATVFVCLRNFKASSTVPWLTI